MIIETARLRLVPLTLSYVTSAPDDRATLAREMGAEVPASWPPELWDQDAQDWTRRMLEQDAATDWIPRCIVLRQPQPIVCGVIGIAAPDADGAGRHRGLGIRRLARPHRLRRHVSASHPVDPDDGAEWLSVRGRGDGGGDDPI